MDPQKRRRKLSLPIFFRPFDLPSPRLSAPGSPRIVLSYQEKTKVYLQEPTRVKSWQHQRNLRSIHGNQFDPATMPCFTTIKETDAYVCKRQVYTQFEKLWSVEFIYMTYMSLKTFSFDKISFKQTTNVQTSVYFICDMRYTRLSIIQQFLWKNSQKSTAYIAKDVALLPYRTSRIANILAYTCMCCKVLNSRSPQGYTQVSFILPPK